MPGVARADCVLAAWGPCSLPGVRAHCWNERLPRICSEPRVVTMASFLPRRPGLHSSKQPAAPRRQPLPGKSPERPLRASGFELVLSTAFLLASAV